MLFEHSEHARGRRYGVAVGDGATLGEGVIRDLIQQLVADAHPGALELCYSEVAQILIRTGLLLPVGPVPADGLPRALLREREAMLGPATVGDEPLALLLRLATEAIGAEPPCIVHHVPSFSAAAKQAALDGPLPLKTVTLRVGPLLVLCTGASDYVIDRHTLRRIGQALGLGHSERRKVTINPGDVRPEIAFGMLRGMVSPFLPSTVQAPVAAIALVTPVRGHPDGKVAIPVSPCESLVVPGSSLETVVAGFANQRSPSIPLVTILPDC